MEEKIITVKTYSIPHGTVLFRVLRNGEPVAGATIKRMQQTAVVAGVETPILDPAVTTKTTDESGEAAFPHLAEVVKSKWMVVAFIPKTGFGFLKSGWVLVHKTAYDIKLKEYKKPPTMYVEFRLRDMMGAEAFGAVLGAVEKWKLEHAGFTNVKVLGEGSRKVKVEFTPPWGEESPLWIDFTATTKGIIALVLIVAILGIIFVMAWKFGEKVGPAIGAGVGLVILFLVLSAARRRG